MAGILCSPAFAAGGMPQGKQPVISACTRPAASGPSRAHNRWQFNPTKMGTAFLSAANSGRLAASGVLKLTVTAGTVLSSTGIGAPPGAAMIAWGGWNLHASSVALDKASLLAGEASRENFSDASARNFQALLPMGQHFDDPGEPSAMEYYSEQAHNLGCIISEVGTLSP